MTLDKLLKYHAIGLMAGSALLLAGCGAPDTVPPPQNLHNRLGSNYLASGAHVGGNVTSNSSENGEVVGTQYKFQLPNGTNGVMTYNNKTGQMTAVWHSNPASVAPTSSASAVAPSTGTTAPVAVGPSASADPCASYPRVVRDGVEFLCQDEAAKRGVENYLRLAEQTARNNGSELHYQPLLDWARQVGDRLGVSPTTCQGRYVIGQTVAQGLLTMDPNAGQKPTGDGLTDFGGQTAGGPGCEENRGAQHGRRVVRRGFLTGLLGPRVSTPGGDVRSYHQRASRSYWTD